MPDFKKNLCLSLKKKFPSKYVPSLFPFIIKLLESFHNVISISSLPMLSTGSDRKITKNLLNIVLRHTVGTVEMSPFCPSFPLYPFPSGCHYVVCVQKGKGLVNALKIFENPDKESFHMF